ncbi:uncharacterized protein F5891DRAFT_942871, partial [Suillus fuscotomentosus]
EHKAANGLQEGMVIGRVLITKLPVHKLLVTQAERINDILAQVPPVQNDAQWNCLLWLIEALAVLRAKGGNFSTIPEVTVGGQMEGKIKVFGDMAKDSVLKRPGSLPDCASNLPHFYMRVRQK